MLSKETSRLRVAIIGAGIGAEHLSAYRQLPDRFRVIVLCDLDQARAQRVIGTEEIAISTDLHSVMVNREVDLVDICLPPHLHFETAMAALKAGKHVVCEKPLVHSLAQADALIEMADQTGLTVSPVFQYRYGPALQQLRALIDAGLAGKAYSASVETHWHRDAHYYAIAWRGTWQGECGGAVLCHAIHNHDLLTHVLGPVASLSAYCRTCVNDIETEDCAAIALQMESGALATSSITLGAATDSTRLCFCFEGLTATSGATPYAPTVGDWTFTARAPNEQAELDRVLASVVPGPSGYHGYFAALHDALKGKSGGEVVLHDGRQSIELVSAIYLSSRSGRQVKLPLDSRQPVYASWLPETERQALA